MQTATEIARSLGYDIWDLYNETKSDTDPLLADDGLHFNDHGHAFIADRVRDWLKLGEIG
ncbi:MAG: hypothetical protein WC205_04540 [Opitutaceae bacterium]|jgi:lysophospholipase L1-like esterase